MQDWIEHAKEMGWQPGSSPTVFVTYNRSDSEWLGLLDTWCGVELRSVTCPASGEPYRLDYYSGAEGTLDGHPFPSKLAEKMWRCRGAIVVVSQQYFLSKICSSVELPFLAWRNQVHGLRLWVLRVGKTAPGVSRVKIPAIDGHWPAWHLDEAPDDRHPAFNAGNHEGRLIRDLSKEQREDRMVAFAEAVANAFREQPAARTNTETVNTETLGAETVDTETVHAEPVHAEPASPPPASAAQAGLASPSAPRLAPGHRVGATFRDGAVCPEMVVIPPGRFQMGSPLTDPEHDLSECPVHEVTIDYVFAVGKFPVTRGQWRTFLAATGRSAVMGLARRWEEPGFPQGDDHPVVFVTWDDAREYARWLAMRTRYPYRLLSESEYEYINRAGSRHAYFWGDSPADMGRYANGNVPAVKDRFQYTSPVGSFAPNDFGLYDTTGNVWCWTQDCWHNSYEGAPSDGSAWVQADGAYRVVRGGSLNNPPCNLRVAYRAYHKTTRAASDVGFRVARADF